DPALGEPLRLSLERELDAVPVRQAARLRSEARYNAAAGGANALFSSAFGLAQGNPTVIARLGLALGRVFGRGAILPRERKELWMLRNLAPEDIRALAPDERAALRERRDSLARRDREQTAADLAERVREALRHYKFAEARLFLEALEPLGAE